MKNFMNLIPKNIKVIKFVISAIMIVVMAVAFKVGMSSFKSLRTFDFNAPNAQEKINDYDEDSFERKYLNTAKEVKERDERFEERKRSHQSN